VSRRVGGDEDGLDAIVLEHFLQRRIGLGAPRLLRHVGTTVGKQVADGDDFHVGMILQVKLNGELAEAWPTSPILIFRSLNGLQARLGIDHGLLVAEAGDDFGGLGLGFQRRPPAANMPVPAARKERRENSFVIAGMLL